MCSAFEQTFLVKCAILLLLLLLLLKAVGKKYGDSNYKIIMSYVYCLQ